MYKVYMNGQPLHDPERGQQEYICETAVLMTEVNTQGSFDFSCPAGHKLWDSIKPRTCKIRIDRDGATFWEGRIISVERGWKNTKICHAEGNLSFFRDSIIQPFAFKGTPYEFLEFVIQKHNASVYDTARQFTIGRVSVQDPNNLIVRSSDYAMTGWEILQEKCFESSLGGYIVLKGKEVSWLEDFANVDGSKWGSRQFVEFGKNLIDLAIETNAEDVANVIIPYGAQFEESDQQHYQPEPTPSGSAGDKWIDWDGNRLTIAEANYGVKELKNADAIFLWGGRVVKSVVWDDITVASNLKTAGQAWLDAEVSRILTSIAVTAADLSLLDSDMDSIDPGLYVYVKSNPHLINTLMLCTAKSTDIIDPSKTAITLGVGPKPLTSMIGGIK